MSSNLPMKASDNSANPYDSPPPDWRRPAMIGYLIIILTFGVLGGWAAYARLDSAVVASGVVAVESNRKTVQHLEGGIVSEVLVREGQRVEEDQLLFKLDDTQFRANLDVAQNQLDYNVAQEARLIAERNFDDKITFPAELTSRMSREVAVAAVADQRNQFAERRATIAGQISILQARVKQLSTEIEGLTLEKAATLRQLGFITEELVDLRHLLEKNLVQKSRVLALERENSRLEGLVGRSTVEMAKSENSIGETQLQIHQLKQKFAEDVNTALLEARQKIADLRERVRVTQDALRRSEIRSPKAGVVQNVRVATVGGVIRSGDPLLEVVPENDELIIQAQISPTDIDNMKLTMQAEVKISSFHAEQLPVILGRVTSLSRDRLVDETTRQPYFLARILVNEQDIPPQLRGRIIAGMQADVIVPTGERTVVDYFVRPLQNRARKALREQ